MQFLVKYEDSMNEYETLLAKNVANLTKYSKNRGLSEPASREEDRIYEVMKSKLDTAQKNLTTLKTKYKDLNRSNVKLNPSEPDFKEKYFLYLECQEVLRLEFINVIDECKLINLCIDGILKGNVRLKHILAMDKTSNEATKRLNPSKCPECGKMLLGRARMKRHLRLKHTTTASAFESLENPPTFSSKATNEIKLIVSSDQNEDTVSLKLLKCPECDTLFTNEDSLKNHLTHAPNHSLSRIKANSEQKSVALKQSDISDSASKSLEHSPTALYTDEIEKSILSSKQTNPNNSNRDVVSVSKCISTTDSKIKKKKALVSSKKQNGITRFNADVSSVEECTSTTVSEAKKINVLSSSKKRSKKSRNIKKSYVCNICDNNFSTRQNLYRHERLHKNFKLLFSCSECGNLYTRKCHVERHMQSAHKPPHKLDSLKVEQKNTPKRVPVTVVCKICNKKYYDKSTLNRHIQSTHEKRKPYKCADCGKLFSMKYYLRNHIILTHMPNTSEHFELLPDQEFSCNYCDRVFNIKRNLERHIKSIHHDIKAYSCAKCGKSFAREDSMKRHSLEVRCKRNWNSYSCAHCDYKSKSKKCLAFHLKKKHANLKMKECNDICGGDVTAPTSNPTASLKIKKRKRLDTSKENETSNCNHSTPERTKCDKSFARGDAVVIKRKRRSLEVHRNRKSYSCAYCDYQNKPRAFVAFHLKKKHANSKMKKSRDTCGGVVTAKTSNPTTSLKIKKGKRLVKSKKNETPTLHVRSTNYVEHVVPNYTDEDFIRHFRLGREATYQLISQFGKHEIYTSLYRTNGKRVLSPEKHILTFLWFVGHQTKTHQDVADIFNITQSSIHNIITRVSDYILTLSNTVIRVPNAAEKRRTRDHFFNQNGYPGAIGVIDRSCYKIKDSKDNPDLCSIQLQGVVNEKLNFIDIFIRYPGAVDDACNSDIYGRLNELCAGGYHILGGNAYPLMCNIMVPYEDNGHLTAAQKFFNEKHSSCRVMVGNVFDILKQRFPQLYHVKVYGIERIAKIIHACCILHNIASIDDVRFFEPPMLDCQKGLLDVQNEHIDDIIFEDHQDAKAVRDGICDLVFTRRSIVNHVCM